MFLVDEHKVELLAVEVAAGHLHLHSVAQAVAVAVAAAYEAVVFLVEVVEVVGQVAYRHQALALVVVKLHVQAPLGHARDDAGKYLAQVVGHILDLLVLDGCALGVGGQLLHGRGVLTLLLELVDAHAAAAAQIALQQAVHHHVGVAAYGRCEMGVVVKAQAVVADIGGGIHGLGHRADGQGGEEILLALALDVGEHAVDGAVDILGRAAGLHLVSKVAAQAGQVGELAGVGLVVHTVYKSLGFLAGAGAADEGGDGAVGQQHEFLDELVGVFAFLEVNRYGMALVVDVEAHLGAVKFHRAIVVTLSAQYLGQAVEGEYLVAHVALAGLDDGLSLVVCKAAVGAYDGAADLAAEHAGAVVHLKDYRESELFLVGAQRADAVGQMLGQHRYRAVDQIDRCGAALGLSVDDGVWAHVVCHIGDMHAHLPVAAGQLTYRQGVVEVLCIGGVDGKGGDLAHVASGGYLLGGDAGRNLVGGLLHSGGVAVRQAKLGQDGVHLGVVLAVFTQDVDHLAAGVGSVVGPVGDAHHSLVAGDTALEFGLGDEDVGGQILGVGIEGGKVLVDAQGADESLVFGLDNLGDHGLGLAALDTGGDAYAHAVAVEGVERVALGHKYGLAVVVGHDTVFAVAQAHEGARGRDSVDRHLVLAGRHLDEVAVKGELGQVQGHGALLGRGVEAAGGRDLLVIECLAAARGYVLVDGGVERSLVGRFGFGFCHWMCLCLEEKGLCVALRRRCWRRWRWLR